MTKDKHSSEKKEVRMKSKLIYFVTPLFLAFIVLAILFLSGFIVYKDFSKELILTGTKVKFETDKNEFTIEAYLKEKNNFVLSNRYNFIIREEFLSKEYNYKLLLPFWFNKANLEVNDCINFKVSYSKILGNIYVLDKFTFESSCVEFPETISSLDLLDLQDKTMKMLTSYYKEEEGEFPVFLECRNNVCDGTYLKGPNAWYRYAQFSNDLTNKVVDYSKYLEDFNNYASDDFDWKLFQYGHIANLSLVENDKYANKYIEYIDNLTHEGYFISSQSANNLDFFYTTDNPPSELTTSSFEDNYKGQDSGDFDLSAGRVAYDIVALSYAYQITEDQKYINAINQKLSNAHQLLYFQDDVKSTKDVEYKASTCNVLFADVKTYEVTKDDRYLDYLDYIVEKDYINYFYSDLKMSETDYGIYAPMSFIPCLESFEIMIRLDDANSKIYEEYETKIINYVLNNKLIDLDEDSKTYGALFVVGTTLDEVYYSRAMSSTAWFVKILSDINNRGGL